MGWSGTLSSWGDIQPSYHSWWWWLLLCSCWWDIPPTVVPPWPYVFWVAAWGCHHSLLSSPCQHFYGFWQQCGVDLGIGSLDTGMTLGAASWLCQAFHGCWDIIGRGCMVASGRIAPVWWCPSGPEWFLCQYQHTIDTASKWHWTIKIVLATHAMKDFIYSKHLSRAMNISQGLRKITFPRDLTFFSLLKSQRHSAQRQSL